MKQNLKITISGLSATGKSTIAYGIISHLKSCGFEVELISDCDNSTEKDLQDEILKTYSDRVLSLAEKVKIQVETKQLNRDLRIFPDGDQDLHLQCSNDGITIDQLPGETNTVSPFLEALNNAAKKVKEIHG